MKEKKHSATTAIGTQPPELTRDNPGDFQGEISGELLIFRYSRAEAIADGILIDASELAREAGFKYPVALTTAAWQEAVAVSPADSGHD